MFFDENKKNANILIIRTTRLTQSIAVQVKNKVRATTSKL